MIFLILAILAGLCFFITWCVENDEFGFDDEYE